MATKKTYDEVRNNANYRRELVLKVKGRKEWIECEGYECCYILDEDLPKGKYSYYCRHSESNLSLIVSVKKEKGLTCNFWGCIVTDEPLTFGYGSFKDELEISRMIDDTDNHDAIVMFGSTAANAYLDGGFGAMKKVLDEGDGCLVRREFWTDREREAYFMGLEDQEGWEGSQGLDRADIYRHGKAIEKLLND